ncbi:MAG TPA: DUF5946 family protein [Saprospiraceae bacterium]|nr:DUF5946 family protein [Saprospiraceae bacterium]HMP23891.1 DUF5946 family protein [Saprospiraceae bacterium]
MRNLYIKVKEYQKMEVKEKIKCLGCGALVDNLAGQAHEYIGAAQGCWNLYGQILAKEYGEYNYPPLTHRLTVDTYAIQHPGHPSRKSIQSLNIHLISLYLILIKGFNGETATQKMGQILSREPKFEWLEPPTPNGSKTVIDVLIATNQVEHENYVREWSESVWKSWFSKHKQKIEKLVNDNF